MHSNNAAIRTVLLKKTPKELHCFIQPSISDFQDLKMMREKLQQLELFIQTKFVEELQSEDGNLAYLEAMKEIHMFCRAEMLSLREKSIKRVLTRYVTYAILTVAIIALIYSFIR